MNIKRPKLSDVINLVSSVRSREVWLKLTESGGFEISAYHIEGSVKLEGNDLRKAVRKALDAAENLLHDRRRELSKAISEE